jgi:hypothetical protein
MRIKRPKGDAGNRSQIEVFNIYRLQQDEKHIHSQPREN